MSITSLILTELFGTALLIIMGNGIVANVVLKGTKGENAGWLSITIGWGFAVTVAALISNSFDGAGWLNPAVTLGVMINGIGDAVAIPLDMTNGQALAFCFGIMFIQIIGAFLGQLLLDILYWKHIKMTLSDGELGCSNVLGMHSTGATTKSIPLNFLMEMVATAILVFAILGLGHWTVSGFIGPIIVGIVVLAIGLSLGGTTGYAINPARDLGPRIAHMLLFKKSGSVSDWTYAWIPVLAPLAGGALAGVITLLAN
ncbi:glycerol uptake facilitator protein [Spiroplasma sp. TIUS-1]|uniref:MIP/aquaporin family protein n=1 Tax=Spiroplasma sp. TIUS-1 TaxID=216963 RepID=UPI00139802D1|nr:MIP/aquaporin family protein [Spiroplasma sp. TIUS-1]QHX35680.1 glycerol uptake facilitator protein [Spiroplasma sp. TIUS-1]